VNNDEFLRRDDEDAPATQTEQQPDRTSKEPKVKSPRELDGARYAALDCRAHSDQVRRLHLGEL
jgi:hypothetical protein